MSSSTSPVGAGSRAIAAMANARAAAATAPVSTGVPSAPLLSDADVQEAAEAARKAAGAAQGRESTILTSGLGVSSDTLKTSKKTLLGA